MQMQGMYVLLLIGLFVLRSWYNALYSVNERKDKEGAPRFEIF